MARFYIGILVHGQEISLWKSYSFVACNLAIIFITLFRYFVHGQFLSLIEMADDSIEGLFFRSANLVVVRITRYIAQVCPFVMATSITFLLTYFARDFNPDEPIDDDEANYETSYINEGFAGEQQESIRGSISQLAIQEKENDRKESEFEVSDNILKKTQSKEMNHTVLVDYDKGNMGFSTLRVKVIRKEFQRREQMATDTSIDDKSMNESRARQLQIMLRNEVTSFYTIDG